jgi:hypothetical protein
MTFHIGQKVVCVDVSTHVPGTNWDFDMDGLAEGGIYTVANLRWLADLAHGEEGMCLEVVEINRKPCLCCNKVIPFIASRFRPLTERKLTTDTSIFLDMLNQEPVRV